MIIAVHVASVSTEAVEGGGEVIEIKIGKLEMTRINKATITKKAYLVLPWLHKFEMPRSK